MNGEYALGRCESLDFSRKPESVLKQVLGARLAGLCGEDPNRFALKFWPVILSGITVSYANGFEEWLNRSVDKDN
jgi:hypothetical protein